MTNFTCNLKNFEKYIHDSSAAIFSEESNKKHDWNRRIPCSANVEGKSYDILIVSYTRECFAESVDFLFYFDIEIKASSGDRYITKTEARKIILRITDEMRFHPNIKIQDVGYYGEKSTGDDRYHLIKPVEFRFKDEYCWDEIPERADQWVASVGVWILLNNPVENSEWGGSFDLDPDPIFKLRQAIRNRDEEIARKEEIVRKEARERQETYDKLKDFLNSIGHFDVSGVPFSRCWIAKEQTFELDRSAHGLGSLKVVSSAGGTGSFSHHTPAHRQVTLSITDGFNHNVDRIIKWAVENGAREL